MSPTTARAVVVSAGAGEAPDQRARILDEALRLMAERGVHATSMRSLAAACGLNVATIYHYFPGKQALLEEVVAHQSYDEQLAEVPPVGADGNTTERLGALVEWIWTRMAEQTQMWRLLLGESLRGGTEAMGSAAELSDRFEAGLVRWLELLVPELPGDRPAMARVLRAVIYGTFVETLPLGEFDRSAYFAERSREVAEVLAGPV